MFRYPVPLKPEQLQMIALLIDATVQAREVQAKLEAMLAELGNDHLAEAADALEGIETQVRYVAIAMRRVAELDQRYPLQ